MTRDEAMAFLMQNQPLPDDGKSLCAIIGTFNEVRNYFMEYPDPECVSHFLNCFGKGSGYGIYQLIEDVILKYDESIIIPHLNSALFSPHPSVRYWCAQIAQRINSEKLDRGLIYVYEQGDLDVKCASLTALFGKKNLGVIEFARTVFATETDELLRNIAEEIING